MSSVYYGGKIEMKPEFEDQKNKNLSSFEEYPFVVPQIYLMGRGEEYYPQDDFSWDEDSIVEIREKSIVKYTKSIFTELLAKDENGDIIWIDGRTAPYSNCWDGEYLNERRMAQEYTIEEYCLHTLERKRYKMKVEDVRPMDEVDRSRLAEIIDMKKYGLDYYIQNETFMGYYGTDKKLVIPEGVKKIDNKALLRHEFESITFPTSLIEFTMSPMVECKVKQIFVAEGNSKYYVQNGMLIDRDTSTIVWAYAGTEIPTDGSVNKIGKTAFHERTDIEKIVIPSAINEIGEWAFCGCCNLKEISIPNSIKVIEKHAFGNCPALRSGKVPDLFLDNGLQIFDAKMTKCKDGTILFKENGRSFPSNAFYF